MTCTHCRRTGHTADDHPLPADHPQYDAFYDASDDELAVMVSNAVCPYTEGYVFAPAEAGLAGSGTGLAAAHTVRAVAKRTDGGFSRDVEIIETCWDYDRN